MPVNANELPIDLPENASIIQSGDQHIENQPVVAGDAAAITRMRQPANYDGTYVSRERCRALGISDQENVKWKLDPKIHNGTVNSLDNWLYEPGFPGRRVVPNKIHKTDTVKNMDCVLVAYPAIEDELQVKLNEQGQQEFLNDVEEGDYAGIPRHRPETPDEMAARGRREAEVHAQMGLIGQYEGMAWQEVLRLKGRDWWEKTQAQYRGGPVGQDLTDEEAEALNDRRRQSKEREARGRGDGGKFVSIPQNVRPKNISQTLGRR